MAMSPTVRSRALLLDSLRNHDGERMDFLSLGAGVQSSCIALMATRNQISPMPKAAIFADTQAEPASVYEWLNWLEKQLPFPVFRVTRGSLTAESLRIREHSNGHGRWAKSLIPAFILNADGSRGIMGRQCTFNYKVEMLEKATRHLAGIKRGQKHSDTWQWIGISWDERSRMKLSRISWLTHRYPLIEMKMTRRDCLVWLKANGFPQPPRSACIYCPFHSNKEWRRLKDHEPVEFEKAIQFEKDLQAVKAQTDNKRGVPYLHPSLKPLSEVDLSTEAERGQAEFGWQDFENECAGMCGV